MIRRIAIILLLLGCHATAATSYTWTNANSTGNWKDAGNWDQLDGQWPGKNDLGDRAYFSSNNADNCTLDGALAFPIGELLTNLVSGYIGTIAIGTNTLDVDGGVFFINTMAGVTTGAGGSIECEGTFFADIVLPNGLTVTLNGTGDVTTISGNRADLVIDTVAGTHTAITTGHWDSFLLSGGTYVDSGRPHTIAGSIVISAGTFTSTGTWTMSASGNLAADATGWAIKELQINAGVTATLTARCYFEKATLNATATLTGAQIFHAFWPTDNDFLDMAGTVVANVNTSITLNISCSNSGAIKGNSVKFMGGNDTLTQTGVVTTSGITRIYPAADDQYSALIIGVADCDLGNVDLGYSTNRAAKLDLGNGAYAVTMASLDVYAGATAPATELDFGDAVITLSGTMNGQYIDCSGNAVGGLPATVEGGTISNVDVSGYAHVDARGIGGSQPVDGGGNNNVRFARGLIGGGVL